jgi:hypothetical protein
VLTRAELETICRLCPAKEKRVPGLKEALFFTAPRRNGFIFEWAKGVLGRWLAPTLVPPLVLTTLLFIYVTFQVLHNIAVSEYFSESSSDPQKFLGILEKTKVSSFWFLFITPNIIPYQ